MTAGFFFTVFALIFVAELPGKTTFATILLAARSHPFKVFLGACAAFALHVAIAVAAGRLLARMPAQALQSCVGTIFVALAYVLWREGSKDEKLHVASSGGFQSAFALVFIAQWGDPSQLATAALAARYSPREVALPATLAFWTIAALASAVGHRAKRIPAKLLHRAAAVVFLLLGLFLLARSSSVG